MFITSSLKKSNKSKSSINLLLELQIYIGIVIFIAEQSKQPKQLQSH